MDNATLLKTFKDDAASMIERLNNTLLHLEKDRSNLNLVHQAFRFSHSIKSEASYLQLDGVTKASHNLETLLEIIRREKREIGPGDMKNLYEGVDELEESLRSLEQEPPADETEAFDKASAPVKEQSVSLGALERDLLQEARDRGERLYRLSCEIDESAPMKKSRFFLLVNNLELIVNVIAMSPSLEEDQDDLFKRCVVIFTSDGGEEPVREAVNVDQVKRVQITALDYESFQAEERLPEGTAEEKGATKKEGFYRVPSGTLDEVMEYMDQIKLNVFRLGNEHPDLSTIRKLTDNMETLLKDLRKVRLAGYFSGFGRLVRDLSEGLGKKGDLEMNLGDLSLDRNSAELLSDILVHLIRNAVDHGIEPPEERVRTGKPEYGTIEVDATLEGDVVTLRVRDDGRGIDAAEVRRRAEEQGLVEDPESAELLDILALPGFSTRQEATDYSGRGVGLDVIVAKLENTGGGSLHLETTPGDGSTFTISLPQAYKPLGILLVRSGEETLALPQKNIAERFLVEDDRYDSDDKGFLTYDGYPVYSTGGRLFAGQNPPAEPYGILLQHLGSTGVFLADELLFEKEIPEGSLTLRREIRPHIFSLDEGSGSPGYFFLNPSMISLDL